MRRNARKLAKNKDGSKKQAIYSKLLLGKTDADAYVLASNSRWGADCRFSKILPPIFHLLNTPPPTKQFLKEPSPP